ncbi:TrmH family RNA methyltransferase [Candidatus Oscillochloris fontis]|uniref:TrmH family RNA methyltransferase n=1 Tax=Candidatus Oscillochloris fontis TaxID=2496868 RepID=UPI00101CEA6B|nr:TrmH family RNA methyltransferase [Candidatus Oscillochloris fontis]
MERPTQQLEGQELYERQKQLRSQMLYPPAPRIIAANLQIPDNLGSVLRLADAAGSSSVIFIGAIEIDHKRIHKIARNCDSLIPWEVYDSDRFFEEIHLFRPLVALEITSCSSDIFSTNMPDNCTFVIGNERHGIPEKILSECDFSVHIPMYGTNGSMNVTHALAIALFEWRRQKLHYAKSTP